MERTHVKDLKDPVQVQPPGRNRFLIALRVEHPREPISFTLLCDVPLDLGHSPTIGGFVSESTSVCDAGQTHIANCPIASNTD